VEKIMDIISLEKKFEKLGARLKVGRIGRRETGDFQVDVQRDRQGEFFEIRLGEGVTLDLQALDVRPELRHLLLMVRHGARNEKYLCGHDERHLFVAGVTDQATSVISALEALQPLPVRAEVIRKVRRAKNRFRRHNEAFIRQGEWFFVPAPEIVAEKEFIFHDEPITRGGGSKPHICEELYRCGGETVYVCSHRPNGIARAEYERLLAKRPHAAAWNWRVMTRAAAVFARGRVRHPDHRTIVLSGWHRVFLNTEHGRNVAFLD
jgi:hypothetical protein